MEYYLNYIYSVFSYLLLIPGALMCLLPVWNHLRIPGKKLSIILFPILILYSLLMPFVEQQLPWIKPNTLFILSIGLCFLVFCVVTDLEKIKLLYLTISIMAMLSFGGLAYFMIESYIKNHNIDSPFYDTAMVSQWSITIILSCIIILPVFCKKITWTLENFHMKSVWNVIWMVPALITTCNYIMIPIDYKNTAVGRIFSLYLLIDCSLLLLFLLFQVMFYLIAKSLIEKSEHEKETQILEIQSIQYRSLLGYVEETSKLRHDFRHSAHTLLSLARENDMDKMKQYLEEYNHELETYQPRFFCMHSAANAILAYYAGIAESRKIKINWHIDLPNQLAVSDVEFCSILGNLLENALDGCMTVAPSQRYINLSIDLTRHKELYIISVNSFDGSAKLSEQKYLSTKKDGNGIGLRSISITAEKYNGMTRFYHSDGEFCSEIMLNLSSL